MRSFKIINCSGNLFLSVVYSIYCWKNLLDPTLRTDFLSRALLEVLPMGMLIDYVDQIWSFKVKIKAMKGYELVSGLLCMLQ